MNDYRRAAKETISDAKWTVWKALGAFAGIFVVLALVGFGTRALGLWGDTYVKRKVFEESYQRQSSLKERIAVDKATLAEIEAQLEIPELDDLTRANLEAQARAIRIRIKTAERQLD